MSRGIAMDKMEGQPVRLRGSIRAELRRLAAVFHTSVSTIIRRAVETEIKRLQEKEQQS